RRCRGEISEIKLKEANSAIVPVLERLQEVGEKPALIKRSRPLLAAQRLLPLRCSVDFYEHIRAKPQPRLYAVATAFRNPIIGAIRPVRLSPFAISPAR